MIENPLEVPPPDDKIERVAAFARDLAYGAMQELWPNMFSGYATYAKGLELRINDEAALRKLIAEKWQGDQPSHLLLATYGYFQEHARADRGRIDYLLTQKAFNLLAKPATPPSVFISYSRSQSSAFGLLIEARLKLAGNPNPFIDKNLTPGDEWNQQLEQRIAGARYFICLVAAQTLASPHVREELEWAEKYGSTVISICHSGGVIDANAPAILQSRHAIFVRGETALDYETAINQVLNALGYATY
jgi:hypothetical protein